MRIRFYFDEDAMDSDVVRALRLRGVDVRTAHDLELIGSSDEKQLDRATANGRVRAYLKLDPGARGFVFSFLIDMRRSREIFYRQTK